MGEMKKGKAGLKAVKKTVTTRVGTSRKLTTMQRKYWVKPEENHAGLRKIGMSDNEVAIVNKLLEHSNQVYIAGGAVRDLLMGKQPHDFDIATDLHPDQVIGIFGEKTAKLTGNVFPTVRVKHGDAEMEISTFRRETRNSDAEGDRNAVKVEYADNIDDDLARRDLTINALAINAKTGDFVDRFGGVNDIKNKIVRFVNDPYERLREDPMRYLRAIRFKLKIGGEYAPETRTALASNDMRKLFLEKVTKDRIKEELIKGVSSINKFSGFFHDLKEFGMLGDLFPSVDALVNLDGGHHHAETVYEHSMDVGDNYGSANPEDKRDILGKFAAYLHDVGKPDAYDHVEGTFLEHDAIGAEKVQDFMKTYRFSNEETKFVQTMIENHMRKPTTLKGVRRMLTEIGDNFDYLVKLFKADTVSNRKKTPEEIEKSIEVIDGISALAAQARQNQESFMKVNVNGNDLMTEFNLKPGPHLKDMLEYAKDLVLENPENNNKQHLLTQIKERFKV